MKLALVGASGSQEPSYGEKCEMRIMMKKEGDIMTQEHECWWCKYC